MECKKQILMVNPDNRLTWLKGHNYYQVAKADRSALAPLQLSFAIGWTAFGAPSYRGVQ
jgi:hypothetical protein